MMLKVKTLPDRYDEPRVTASQKNAADNAAASAAAKKQGNVVSAAATKKTGKKAVETDAPTSSLQVLTAQFTKNVNIDTETVEADERSGGAAAAAAGIESRAARACVEQVRRQLLEKQQYSGRRHTNNTVTADDVRAVLGRRFKHLALHETHAVVAMLVAEGLIAPDVAANTDGDGDRNGDGDDDVDDDFIASTQPRRRRHMQPQTPTIEDESGPSQAAGSNIATLSDDVDVDGADFKSFRAAVVALCCTTQQALMASQHMPKVKVKRYLSALARQGIVERRPRGGFRMAEAANAVVAAVHSTNAATGNGDGDGDVDGDGDGDDDDDGGGADPYADAYTEETQAPADEDDDAASVDTRSHVPMSEAETQVLTSQVFDDDTAAADDDAGVNDAAAVGVAASPTHNEARNRASTATRRSPTPRRAKKRRSTYVDPTDDSIGGDGYGGGELETQIPAESWGAAPQHAGQQQQQRRKRRRKLSVIDQPIHQRGAPHHGAA
jgi:hypothetical protein